MSVLPEDLENHNRMTQIGATMLDASVLIGSFAGVLYYAERTNTVWLPVFTVISFLLLTIGMLRKRRKGL